MKVLEGTSPVELLAVPDWLVDEPELHKRGVVPAECLKPVSIVSVVPRAFLISPCHLSQRYSARVGSGVRSTSSRSLARVTERK